MDPQFSNEKITTILNQYKRKREKEKERYINLKNNEEFKEANKERARQHYIKNKELKKQKYQDNKELIKAKNLLYYYKSNNNIHVFKMKHEDKYELVKDLIFPEN